MMKEKPAFSLKNLLLRGIVSYEYDSPDWPVYFWDYLKPWSSSGSDARVFGMKVYGKPRFINRHFIKPFHNHIAMPIRDIRYWFYYRFTRAGRDLWTIQMPEPGYYDEDHLLYEAVFLCLDKYIRNSTGWPNGAGKYGNMEEYKKFSEELLEEPDKNAPEGLQSGQGKRQLTYLEIWEWWKFKRPARKAAKDKELMAIFGRPKDSKDPPITKERYEAFRAEERAIEIEEDEMIKRLIDIRGGLWT